MKTGAWLRGGRGKIAGMVAQKSSDGKGTVLRELVTPSNPQTVDQMATRIAFGTVTQAAALMLPIIGQTFKGQSDEKLNRRRFVALNVPMLKAEALSQQAGNAAKGYFRGKSSSALIPNGYIISEGNLGLSSVMVPRIEEGEIITDNLSNFPFTLTPNEYYSPASVLASILGMENTQQLTLVGIFTTNGETVSYIAVDSGDFVRDSVMRAWRLNLKQDAPAFQFTAEMTEEQLKTAVAAGIDQEKTSPELYSALVGGIEKNGNNVIIDYSYMELLKQDTEDYSLVAAACILSQLVNGVWDYSKSTMVLLPSSGDNALINDSYYGLTFNNALIDYLGSAAASKLYTRKGGTINTI